MGIKVETHDIKHTMGIKMSLNQGSETNLLYISKVKRNLENSKFNTERFYLTEA